jgi:hypothetical protein
MMTPCRALLLLVFLVGYGAAALILPPATVLPLRPTHKRRPLTTRTVVHPLLPTLQQPAVVPRNNTSLEDASAIWYVTGVLLGGHATEAFMQTVMHR